MSAKPTSLQSAVAALEALGCNPIPTNGGGAYIARCPCHDDSTPSLSISTGDKQAVILHCHAGCDPRDILKALGIQSNPAIDKRRIVATYDYHDAQGALISQKVRYEPKDFRQRWPDGHGGWLWKRPRNAPYTLYRLPELLVAIEKGDTVYLVEGEKDADRLAALGLAATSNIEGAAKPGQRAKWRPDYTAQLSGADRVVLIPDNDEPGRAHMAHVAKQLGQRATVVNLSGIPEKGDLSDWLNQGHTADELRALADATPSPKPEADWRTELMRRHDSSQLLKNHYNAVMVVENAFPGLVGYNEFRQRIEARIPAPWRTQPGLWTDADTGELAFHLAREYASFGLDMLAAAIMTVAYRHRFNPAQDRLRELAKQWDGSPRLDNWLVDYLGAAHNDSNTIYLREIGAAWLKGVAARVLMPGCKRDDVLVLRGDQGVGKSTAALAIAEAIHPDTFTDSLGNLDSKDSKAAIRGIIIAELGELSVLNKSDLESIKSYVATSNDHFREAYGRGERDYPRTVSFIGTTNHPTFLKDPTGNRRWWPVTIPASIDIPRLEVILPQLLGEAANRVLSGEAWHVNNRTALEQAETVRRAHFQDDVWTDAALDAARQLLIGGTQDYVTVAGILHRMDVRTEQQTVNAQARIGAILRVAGWRDKKTRVGYWKENKTVWAWYPPVSTVPPTVPPILTVPPTVPPKTCSQIAAVPPVTPCSPYFEDLGEIGDRESTETHDATTPLFHFYENRGQQGEQGEQSDKQRANSVTPYCSPSKQGEQKSQPGNPGTAGIGYQPAAAVLTCAWSDTGRLITKCRSPEPTADKTGCATCGAVKG